MGYCLRQWKVCTVADLCEAAAGASRLWAMTQTQTQTSPLTRIHRLL